jgi:hypothetical protein
MLASRDHGRLDALAPVAGDAFGLEKTVKGIRHYCRRRGRDEDVLECIRVSHTDDGCVGRE